MEYLTEIGGVIVKNGEVVEEFDTFVKPGKPITPKITELTGITNEMVADAPGERKRWKPSSNLQEVASWWATTPTPLISAFLRAAAKRSGIKLEPTYIDTLTMAQAMYPGLHNYKQGTINKHLELPAYEAHRACEDSAALGRIFWVMLNDLKEKQVAKASEINTGLGGNREVLKKKYYHLIILVKNQMGLKNLYKIVSEAHVNYFFKKPRVPRSLLNKYRDGLLFTSACEAGELYPAIVDGTSYEELKRSRPTTTFWRSSLWATMPIWCGRARWTAKRTSRTSTARSSSWARTCTSRSLPPATCTLPSRRMPFTAQCCRRATALKMPTTSRRCSSAPHRICWRSSTICPRRKPTRWWSRTPARSRP